ncbi:unnamed protein product [Closterium sp. NIES-64]|nr:unnamed protein product [Closterium sp. NIES-64]
MRFHGPTHILRHILAQHHFTAFHALPRREVLRASDGSTGVEVAAELALVLLGFTLDPLDDAEMLEDDMVDVGEILPATATGHGAAHAGSAEDLLRRLKKRLPRPPPVPHHHPSCTELLLLGTGQRMQAVPGELRHFVRACGMKLEVLSTVSAVCSVSAPCSVNACGTAGDAGITESAAGAGSAVQHQGS